MTEKISFEQAMERLEKLVEELEEGGTSLEDSLKKFEEGIKLSRLCSDKLKEAQKKIEILTQNVKGEPETEPFEPGGREAKANEDNPGETDEDESQEGLPF